MGALGVLVPSLAQGGPEGPPEARPLGRAALSLASHGVDVVLGHHARAGVLSGVRAVPGRWVPAEVAVVAVYDRYPSRGKADEHRALLDALAGIPLANEPAFVALCRDKLETQRRIGAAAPMPEVEDDPARFAAALDAWGAGFVKPRYGSFGVGVARVAAGEHAPATAPSTVGTDPSILQRAVPPPDGWAGWSVRVLVQRDRLGQWRPERPVVRRSRVDPVVNAARGAAVDLLERVAPHRVDEVVEHAVAATVALEPGPLAVEVGVDLVLDRALRPWVVEVNGTPRGRLEVLAAEDPAWASAHVEACARPLWYLASR